MKKRKFKFSKLKKKTKIFIFIMMFLTISVGYSVISNNLSIIGLIKVAAKKETLITFTKTNTTIKKEDKEISTMTMPVGNETQLTVIPDEGYYINKIECATGSNLTIKDASVGFDTYHYSDGTGSEGITIKIQNNNTVGGGSVKCTFESKRITASDVSYETSYDAEVHTVKDALDKLYTIYGISS